VINAQANIAHQSGEYRRRLPHPPDGNGGVAYSSGATTTSLPANRHKPSPSPLAALILRAAPPDTFTS